MREILSRSSVFGPLTASFYLCRKLDFLYSSKSLSGGQEEETESDVNQSNSSVQLIFSILPRRFFLLSAPIHARNQHDQLYQIHKARKDYFQLMNTFEH